MGKLVYPLADSVIAVSEKLKQSIESNFQNVECVVINNMVGGEFLECKSIPSKSVYDNEFVFVSVGSLVVGKGFDILILAFEKSSARIVPSLHRSSEMLDPSIPTLPFYIYPECVPAM